MRVIGKLILFIIAAILISYAVFAEEIPLSGYAYNYGETECSGAYCKVGDASYGCDEPCFCYDLDGNGIGTCEACCEPRTPGYWKQVICDQTASEQNPNMIIDIENIEGYLAAINTYSDVFSGLTIEEACFYLSVPENSKDMLLKAKKHLLALWLNVVSVKLCPEREVALRFTDNDNVRDVIDEIEAVILDTSSTKEELERVKNIADYLNNGEGLPCADYFEPEECIAGEFGCNEVELSVESFSVSESGSFATGALQNVVVNFYDSSIGSCAYGKNPIDVYNNCPALTSCITGDTGSCSIMLTTGEYMAVAYVDGVYLSNVVDNQVIDVYDDSLTVYVNNAELVLIEFSYEDNGQAGTVKMPGKKTKLSGSELEIVQPVYLNWQDNVQYCPFILSTEDTWLVDVSLQVPEDITVAGSSTQSELLMGESKVMLFKITETPKLTGSAVAEGVSFNAVIKASVFHGDSEVLVKQIVESVMGPSEVQLPKTVQDNKL
ncbi:hypothetical protein KY311_00635, partial [Candidatus Woesearchaeota archaeon]|nr:hypothetical protein [Candidatus Woesearchaeota archaeon]